MQVIRQFEQKGKQANRYDVTILVNGLPLVQIELKKRGVAIREAFNQIHRYSKESFNVTNSLYKYVQLFVISFIVQICTAFCDFKRHRYSLFCQYHQARQKQFWFHHELGKGG